MAKKQRSTLGKITRRGLIFGAVAVTGGAAFGAWQVVRTPPNPLHPQKGATLNPWLIISEDGITVIVPRAEMGQGVQTTLAALVAEELEAEMDQIAVEHGPPAQAYFNAVVSSGREYEHALEPEWQSGWAKVMAEATPKLMSMQITGGSTSTLDAYDKMRIAGAQAREMLIAAAAGRLGLAPGDLRAESGHIIAPDGTALAYGALAQEAANQPPPKHPRLKDPSQWRLLGHSLPRLDMPAKVTGTATFGIDTRLPGMRFATVRMSPRFGAGLISADTSAAEAMPGVEKIAVWEDGIAVIATNTWLAFQAAEAVEIVWADPVTAPDTEGLMAAIEKGFSTKPNVTLRDQGDPDGSLAAGATLTAEYRAPYLAHATMEPMNATALFTGEGLEIWAPNQAPVMARDLSAKAAGLSKGAVTVHTTLLGGGFGRRGMVDYAVLATRVAMEMPGTPVQTTWRREEDMRHDWYRPASIARLAAKLGEDGRIAAMTGEISSPSTIAPVIRVSTGLNLSPADQTVTEGCHDQPYAIPNWRVRGYAPDPGIPVGFWRSVGGSQNGFFHESFIDELAHAAGQDPLEFRLAHIRPEHEPAAKVLEKVAEISGWSGVTPEGVGRGVAHVWSFGTSVAQVVEVAMEEGSIRLRKVWIVADPGRVLDPRNVEAQLFGGAIFGLSAAIHGEITFAGGAVEQENFPDYDALRMPNTPEFEVALLENNTAMGGIGEPGTPPAAPALANALFDLTGERIRALPLGNRFDFV